MNHHYDRKKIFMKNEFDNLTMLEQFEVAVNFMRMQIVNEYDYYYSEVDCNVTRADYLVAVMQEFLQDNYKYVPKMPMRLYKRQKSVYSI